MIVRSKFVYIQGKSIHRLVLSPEFGSEERAVAIFYHGQGDYSEKYIDRFRVFTERGIRCIITEFPGHGKSPGKRGDSGDEKFFRSVLKSNLMCVEDLPFGIMGHSAGGLLALKHLMLTRQLGYIEPSFCWLSSPLLRPGDRKSDIQIKLIRTLASRFPGMTISTGVTSEMCRVSDDRNVSSPEETPWHNRVSLGWGICLLDMAEWVWANLDKTPSDIPLLVTQGGSDPVCKPEHAQEFFEKLQSDNKSFFLLENALHEPMEGASSRELFSLLGQWLDGIRW